MNSNNIVQGSTMENNPALRNFNSKNIKPLKQKNKHKVKSSQKFPMPRNYEPNSHPDRNLSPLELTREMIEYYDNKNKPKKYEKFIEQTLQYKNKQKNKKNKKHEMTVIKEVPRKEEYLATEEEEEVKFETVQNFHFVLCNNVTKPDRSENFLPYLLGQLGKDDDLIDTAMLKDSGASHSLLDVEEFKRLKTSKTIQVKTLKLKMITPNATTENAIQGEVELDMNLEDIFGNKLQFRKKKFLLANLGGSQKCILGYDFLSREDIIIGETPKHMFFNINGKSQAVEIFKCSRNFRKACPTAINNKKITIKPNSVTMIELSCESNFSEITSFENRECTFQPKQLSDNYETLGIVMEPTLSIPRKSSKNSIVFQALITNTNNTEMTIKAGTELGTLEDISQSDQISLSEKDFKTLANNVVLSGSNQSENEVTFEKQEGSEIHTFFMQSTEVNSIFNRRENTEKETTLEDGSIRTQLTSNVEDMLECETYIDPNELLDKEEKLDISMADFSSVPEEMKSSVMDIVGNEMNQVWSKHKWDIGRTDKITHEIKTEPGVTVKDKKRPIPFQREQYARKAVNTLMKYKLVSPVYNSKWATNLVLVQKPAEGELRDTTKASRILNKHRNTKCTWRLTQDLRRVNNTTTNIYKANLPTIDEIISKCRNKIVTQFDINQAYYTVPLKNNETKEKTSFYLNQNMYQWDVMTQGLAGAPHTWTKFMQLIFCDETLKEYKELFPERGRQIKENHWDEFLSIYMDDLDVFSNTYQENLNHMHAVLYILLKEGCLLNPKKAKFMTTNFTTLGININTKENSVSIDRKKAQAILSWPKPSSLLEVMSRIQSLNYLSKNLPKLKEISYPLMTLLREKVFKWEEEHQIAWEHLKQLIRLDIRLSIPDENLEYVTSSDTSKIAIAGNLWNYDPKNGKLYLLGCMSKLLSVSDSLKPPFHKECLALCLNLKNWEAYILGTDNRITALCDARGVMWLHRNKQFSNKLTTISLYISQFRNLVIWHIPGTQNQLADIFSRSYHGSAHKTKEDFKLSRSQAQNLPPLTNPCLLKSEDLFRIFTTLPNTEPDYDKGNRTRRALPTPKPMLDIMKELEETTPEEKFLSARRILEGWNDKNISDAETSSKVAELHTLQTEIEKVYINKVTERIRNEDIMLDEDWETRLQLIAENKIQGIERKCALENLNEKIPPKEKDSIIRDVKKEVFDSERGKEILEKIQPSYYKIGELRVKTTERNEDMNQTMSILQTKKEEEASEEVIVSVLETIDEDNEKEREQSNRTCQRMIATMADLFENKGKVTANTLKKLQESDNFCARTKGRILNGQHQPSFKILKDILVKLEYDTQRQKYIIKIVIPDDIMPMICHQIHKRKTVHQPKTGALFQFRKHFFNKKAAEYMEHAVDNCILCKYTHKPSGKANPGPGKVRTLKIENLKPREAIAIDLAVNLPITKDKHAHALAVVCLKTNYGQIYPLKNKSATEVAKALENGWIKHLNRPKYLYSDMGLEFTGEVKKLCLKYGITQYSTFPHSYQGNRSELLVKAFKNNTRKIIHDLSEGENKKEWDTLLPIIVNQMNKSILYLTKSITRELLMFGDEIEGPSLQVEEKQNSNYYQNREVLKDTCLKEYDKTRINRKKYYKPSEEMNINEHDLVYIKNRKEVYPKSLKVQYIGPMRVTQVYAKGITGYHVLSGEEMSAHFNHVKKMTVRQFEEAMPKDWHADIKKHILTIEKTRKLGTLDLIFEEEEEEQQDN